MDYSDIRKIVLNKKDEIIEWLKVLISFPSENKPPHGYEKSAQDFIYNELTSVGLEVYRFRPDEVLEAVRSKYWLSGRDYSNGRENVVGVWGKEKKSILLSGHIDVAPKEPGEWSVCTPYSPVQIEDRLYGRGSADMKGGLTSMFWALKILKDEGFNPSGKVIFESLVDEEYAGGNGTLASRYRGFNADVAFLSEPGGMEFCIASMGAVLGSIKISGKGGMPYTGKGIPNPVNAAGRIITIIEEWEKIWRESNSHPLFDSPGKELNVIIWDVVSGKREEFVQMGIPVEVNISWIVFCYPNTSEEDIYRNFTTYLEREIRDDDYLKMFDINIEREYHFIRPWETDKSGSSVEFFRSIYEEYAGKKITMSGAPFSCDMALYGEPGNMPVVILGPRGGNLHAPDEWVSIDDILELTGLYASFIINWCSG